MLTTWTPAHMPEKEEIKTRLQTARSQLYDFQMKIKEHKIPVIVLFEGWGSSGKGSTIGKVIKNIDPRFFKVATMSAPTAEELRYPFLYRYFKQIPEAGKFTFLDSGWMEQTCKDCLSGEIEGEGMNRSGVKNYFWIIKTPDGVCQTLINGRMNITKNVQKYFLSICLTRMLPLHHGTS